MILILLLPVSGIITKFLFIRIKLEEPLHYMGKKIICNISIYQPETDTLIEILWKDTSSTFRPFERPVYWFGHANSGAKKHFSSFWKCFPLCTTGNSPIYREILTITMGFFASYCTLINIFSTQLWFYNTHTHTHTHNTHHITFISELLSLKGIWVSQ